MDRRTLIRIAGSAPLLFGVPDLAKGQAQTGVRRLGFLSAGVRRSPGELQDSPLRELGWVEGQNLIVERRYADGRAELLRPLAEELVRLNVDLIVTGGTDAAVAAKNATKSIPIILYSAGDPVGNGLVASLAQPGGNVTGYALMAPELYAKLLELVHELLPSAKRVGVLINSTNPLFRVLRNDGDSRYRSLGIRPFFVDVTSPAKIEDAVGEVAEQRGQALVVANESIFVGREPAIMRAASRYGLPTFAFSSELLEAGALAYYGFSMIEVNQRVAAFIDKVLRGAKPADLPVEQPTKFELGINLKTAKALGIRISRTLLLRADEVIQ
jgi:putative ABC transport system substrate-binding protein